MFIYREVDVLIAREFMWPSMWWQVKGWGAVIEVRLKLFIFVDVLDSCSSDISELAYGIIWKRHTEHTFKKYFFGFFQALKHQENSKFRLLKSIFFENYSK